MFISKMSTVFFVSFVMSLVFSSVNVHVSSDSSFPNVVLFFVDDMKYTREMSESYYDSFSNSYISINTTWINRIRNEGIIFSKSYSVSPKCAPSRYSLLTGRYPSRSVYGISKSETLGYDAQDGIYVDVPTISLETGIDLQFNIANVLKTYRNYSTGMTGKWHLLDGTKQDCGEDGNMIESQYLQCAEKVKETGFDFVDALYIKNINDNVENIGYSHNPEWITHASIQFMNQSYHDNKPFFLYLAHTLTHAPSAYDAITNFDISATPRGYLQGNDIPYNTGMMTRQEILDKVYSEGWNEKTMNQAIGYYWVDESLGALYKWLQQSNILDNTIILVLNDHGEAKNTLYERGICTFQFVRYPCLNELLSDNEDSIINNLMVSHMDVVPTIFDLIDSDLLSNVIEDGYIMDGKSWKNEIGLSSLSNDNFDAIFGEMYQSRAVVSMDGYKYIWRATNDFHSAALLDHPFASEHNQLYDLNNDQEEAISLYNNQEYPEIEQRLQLLLSNHIMDTCVASDGCNTPQWRSNASMSTMTTTTTRTSDEPSNDPTKYPTNAPVVGYNGEYCCHAYSVARYEERCNLLVSQEICQDRSFSRRCFWDDSYNCTNIVDPGISCNTTFVCTSRGVRRKAYCESVSSYEKCIFGNCEWLCA